MKMKTKKQKIDQKHLKVTQNLIICGWDLLWEEVKITKKLFGEGKYNDL